MRTYARVALVHLSHRLERFERVAARCRWIDSTNHADIAMRLRDQLLAEEPNRLRGVRDR